jgi:hypothetical protein
MVVSERPPSTCSIFDTLRQQRITEAFGVLRFGQGPHPTNALCGILK